MEMWHENNIFKNQLVGARELLTNVRSFWTLSCLGYNRGQEEGNDKLLPQPMLGFGSIWVPKVNNSKLVLGSQFFYY